MAVGIEDPGLGIGFEAGEGTEAAGQDLDCVEGALLDGGQRGVGRVVGVARAAVEGGGAAAEFRVFADPGVLVERRDGPDEAIRSIPHLWASCSSARPFFR